MRRFLRLLTLWLLALALPIQGAAAATAMAGHASTSTTSHMMVMPNGLTMDAAAMAAPCHRHGNLDKAGCGACCGPLLTQQALLTVVPVATPWAPRPRPAARAPATVFLTGGTDRPPRRLLA
jgi:hypothetical protein